MARITVEDCLQQVDNRFELVMLASRRAHDIATRGVEPTVEWGNDKATVVALREIAEGNIGWDYMQTTTPPIQEKAAKDNIEAS